MQIEIEGSPGILFELFESEKVSIGMTRDVPGGASIRYVPDSRLPTRSFGAGAPLFTITVSWAGSIAANVFSNWLYDKLSSRRFTQYASKGEQLRSRRTASSRRLRNPSK